MTPWLSKVQLIDRRRLSTTRRQAEKVISLHIPELYAIVRGKVCKRVEFGLCWRIRRLVGGHLLPTMAKTKKDESLPYSGPSFFRLLLA